MSMYTKIRYLLLMCLLAIQSTFAGEPGQASVYQDPSYGYSIRIPRFPVDDNQAIVQRVIWFAPVQDRFAANVNIQVQNLKMTPKDFWDLTQKQLNQIGATLIAHQDLHVAGAPALTAEYTADNGGVTDHFLQLAVFESNRVILVTCTATEASFKQYAGEFRLVLASFRP